MFNLMLSLQSLQLFKCSTCVSFGHPTRRPRVSATFIQKFNQQELMDYMELRLQAGPRIKDEAKSFGKLAKGPYTNNDCLHRLDDPEIFEEVVQVHEQQFSGYLC